MSASKKIKIMLVERDMNMTELAKLLNQSLSNISDKMRRDNFSENDLSKIAELLGYEYEPVFTDKKTGRKV